MSGIPFSKPPHQVAASANLTPFTINVSDAEIDKLRVLLELSPIAPPNWANSRKDGQYGIPRDTLVELVERWRTRYDWRKWESTLNSLPQFKATVSNDDDDDGGGRYTIHFFALFSADPAAIPVLLLHGWPGSVVEFLPLLLKLHEQYHTKENSLPYHLIVPHYVGYGFSDPPPLNRDDFGHVDNARLLSRLMHALGFGDTGYVVQGGDLGGATAPVVAALDPACRLVHVNILVVPPPEGYSEDDVAADLAAGRYPPDEAASLRRAAEFGRRGGVAFVQWDGARPATAGFVVSSGPVSLLAWIGEKMLAWSDPTLGGIDADLLLTNVALYWFSGCYATTIAHHRLAMHGPAKLMSGWKDVTVPLAYSWFRHEISNPPKAWIDATGKVSWYRKHDKGGHFAALELPDVLWKDVEDFVREFWGKTDVAAKPVTG